MDIHFYTDSRGRQPVYDWLQSIKKREPHTFRRAYYLLVMLKENGKLIQSGQLNSKYVKKLKDTDEIWQLRIDDNRVLFFYFSAESIVLTNNFKKKQNKTPKSEIIRAESRKREWINRNK